MDFKKYFNDLPSDLETLGKTSGYQLVKLYAYNFYFNADALKTTEVNDGFTYNKQYQYNVDGIYLNESLDEDTVECLYAYCPGGPIDIIELNKAMDAIANFIESVYAHKYFGHNKQAETILRNYIDEHDLDSGKMTINIKILTDYEPTEQEKYEISKKVENYQVTAKGVSLNTMIMFADDIKREVENNKAPFDYVADGKLILDKPNNALYYKDDSLVCNISALSLKSLWKAEGDRGLLAMNLRYYIKSKNIDENIESSIVEDFDNFWYLNNGIIIVCDDYSFVGNELRLKNFSIVNGGQTSRMIGTIPFTNDFFICCKVVKNTFETAYDKNLFISKVAEATNTQKPIKAKDIIANRVEQRELKTMMSNGNIFMEIKRGEKYNHEIYSEAWQRSKNNELAQDLYSFIYMEPGPARNSVSTILTNKEKYNTIFKNHKYDFDFLRDVIMLEKAYKEYKKKLNKTVGVDTTKLGLVNNGLFYCLATIGYVLKLKYNPEYVQDIIKYRNNPAIYELRCPELAFMHGFIDKSLSYTDFKKKAFELFDYVFTNILIPVYNSAKSINPELAYSNWTKTNTGFANVRIMINSMTFDSKQLYLVQGIFKYFVKIEKDVEDKNIDSYVDYCKLNKKLVAKSAAGYALTDDDKTLRDKLLIYRLNKSMETHKKETSILSDKAIENIYINRPMTAEDLAQYLKPDTNHFCGAEILKIIHEVYNN